MLAIFTIDVVAITVGTFFFLFTIFTIGSAGLMITVLGSLAVATGVLFAYRTAKENTSKGFLKHWAFDHGIFMLKKDKKKWKELEHADRDDYFPVGQDKFFAD